mmetsp:Transcript_8484/g.22938  ORF Transcript_8484/g.22938 Transcript_8484/m.22938 type:complete len:121 (-) Transcript_8484:170-532(-)
MDLCYCPRMSVAGVAQPLNEQRADDAVMHRCLLHSNSAQLGSFLLFLTSQATRTTSSVPTCASQQVLVHGMHVATIRMIATTHSMASLCMMLRRGQFKPSCPTHLRAFGSTREYSANPAG